MFFFECNIIHFFQNNCFYYMKSSYFLGVKKERWQKKEKDLIFFQHEYCFFLQSKLIFHQKMYFFFSGQWWKLSIIFKLPFEEWYNTSKWTKKVSAWNQKQTRLRLSFGARESKFENNHLGRVKKNFGKFHIGSWPPPPGYGNFFKNIFSETRPFFENFL